MIMALERGTCCAFFWNRRWVTNGKVVQIYPEYKDVVRVEKDELEMLLLPHQVHSMDEHEEILARERRERDLAEYADLIAAWKSGKRTKKELADATNTPLMGIGSRIRAARRRNLLA